MDNIVFSLTRVSDAITDRTLYRASVQTNGTLGRDELAALMATRTKQDASLWKYFLDALSEEIGIQLLAGYRINLGQLTTGFAIKGSFMSEDEAFDPERHHAQACVNSLGYGRLRCNQDIRLQDMGRRCACARFRALC